MKSKYRPTRGRDDRRWLCCVLAMIMSGRGLRLMANPLGMTVVSGSATAVTTGSHLNVTVGQITALDWSSFNIQAGETTRFIQPSTASVVFNEIGGASLSQIWGHLTANGTVILANANGFYFGPNSMVKIGGSFVATTAPLPPDPGADSTWQFNGPPPLASIVNYGEVAVGGGHSLYLIADNVENYGTLSAPAGNVGLYAGQQVLLSERPDGRGLSANVQLPSGAVDNEGQITADAGTIALQAQVVNQNGIIQADSVRNQNGVIELVAASELNLGADSQILARGDASPSGSPGGMVTLKAGDTFSDTSGSQIIATGGAQGGNGGNLEISAPNILSLDSQLSAGAQPGWRSGNLLLDPTSITLDTSGLDGAGSGVVAWNDGAGALDFNVNAAFLNFSTIILQATGDITLAPGTTWNLSASTGVNTGQLTLQAGADIVFGSNASIIDQNNWSVNLQAGVDFATDTVQAGVGNIYLNGGAGQTGSGSIETAAGSVSLEAGESVLVGTGHVNTFDGGNISVTALSGDINAGTDNAGYEINGASPLPGNPGLGFNGHLGGISTLGGGNVSLDAGDDVISVPKGTTKPGFTPGASGAYGGGNVTVIAGDQIEGNFLVSNGTGTLEAGVTVGGDDAVTVNNPTADIGAAATPVTLSLITGNWDVYAGGNLYLAGINNPNGVYDSQYSLPVPADTFFGNIDSAGNITAPPATSKNLFTFAPDSGASLWAGNAITLGNPNGATTVQEIYPPNLSLVAGAGGIALIDSVILYPSSQGSLNITDGGNLTGVINNTIPTGITMSDSGLPGYSSFATGHAVTPLYLDDPNPVTVDVAGSVGNFSLTVPTFADITIGGAQPFVAPNGQNIFGAYNFNFAGQNLSPAQTTSINVTGDIIYQGLVTSVSLASYDATPLPAEVFDTTLSTQPAITQYLSYDAVTGELSFRGQMTQPDLAFLQNPTATVNGQQQSIALTSAQQAALAALYVASQGVNAVGSGIHLNGPGRLNITADNMDLGESDGIQVNQTFAPELAAISIYGAALDIDLSGNLEMTTSTIANSGWQGAIQLSVGGTLDLGLRSLFGAPNNLTRGIYTTSDGNISINATGDIDVDGSRIAAYDGGDVTVVSQQGDVNAGAGGNGDVEVDDELVPGPHGQLTQLASTDIPGSGILALTDGRSTIDVGNITVEAHGNINADVGGIEQIAFNHITTPANFISLTAGGDINAGNSGVIGADLRLKAGGDISGVFVGGGAVTVNAGDNFSGTVIGSSTVSISAVGSITGTIVGGESISVSADSITASLISGSVTASGDTSGATEGFSTASVPEDSTKVADDASTTAVTGGDTDSDDKKKKNGGPRLARSKGRVTVILPDLNSKTTY